MKTMMRRALLALMLLVLVLVPLGTASAHRLAGGKGSISGQVLDGTKQNAPLANVSLTLQMAQDQSAQDLQTITTGVNGEFLFTNLSTDKTINYALYTRYLGAQYLSDLISLTSTPTQHVNLTVYEATTSTADIAITRATVLLHEPSAQPGTMTVSEAFFFNNLSARTYVGSLDASNGKPNALLFSLPQGARSVTLGAGFDGYKSIQVDRGFASDAAVPPGESQFAFSFEVTYSDSSYAFDYEAVYPTVQLSMMIPSALTATASGLNAQGPVTVSQQSYQLFSASQLLATHTVQLRLSGLPAAVLAGPPSLFSDGYLWLIGGILLMLFILGSTWFYYRAARTRTQTQKKRHRSTKSAISAKKAPQRGRSKPLPTPASKEDRHKLVLQELLALDSAFEAGKLTKPAYREQRAKLKAQLRAVMSEEEKVARP